MSKLFWTPTLEEMLSCQRDAVLPKRCCLAKEHRWEPKNTADPYTVAVTSDSFTVVGHVPQKATFQIAEHGYKTNHTYYLYWWVLIWWFASKTANPLNLIRRYFWLYGSQNLINVSVPNIPDNCVLTLLNNVANWLGKLHMHHRQLF